MRIRTHANRVLVVVGLLVGLPIVALGERLRRGTGRRVALAMLRHLARACGIRFAIEGTEHLDDARSYVLAPNHTSPVDIVAILMARPDATFVAAAELFRIPLLGAAMRALGTVPIERGSRASAGRQIEELSKEVDDRELVMFPEGQISPTAQLLPFKSGPFVVAIATGAPVVPVAIRGAADVLRHEGRLKVRPGTIAVSLLPPISTDDLGPRDRRRLADSTRTKILHTLPA